MLYFESPIPVPMVVRWPGVCGNLHFHMSPDPLHPLEVAIADFESHGSDYEALLQQAVNVIETVLRDAGIAVQKIEKRLKSAASLKAKMSRPGPKYMTLSDVTDICGVRIITYFTEDVERAAAAVLPAFDVDATRSVDKQACFRPDQFGYASTHYILRFPLIRLSLPETPKKAATTFIELQIRTVLQHGWAEIEHDLGYKTEQAVPRHLTRRFARLAGLLELADQEFSSIRGELLAYQEMVKEKVIKNPTEVTVDQASLLAFGIVDPDANELDRLIGPPTKGERPPEILIDRLLTWMALLNLQRISDIQDYMRSRRQALAAYIHAYYRRPVPHPRCYSLVFLCFLKCIDGAHLDSKGHLRNMILRTDPLPIAKQMAEEFHAAYERSREGRE